MQNDVRVYGEGRCHKARYYSDELTKRGVAHQFRDITGNPEAEAELRALYDDGQIRFPTLTLNGKRLRNPKIWDLDKWLARLDIRDVGIVHDQKSKRFLRFMLPQDHFVAYKDGDKGIVLSHIELHPDHRGGGAGTAFAREVFDYIVAEEIPARIDCPFLRDIAREEPFWSAHFGLA